LLFVECQPYNMLQYTSSMSAQSYMIWRNWNDNWKTIIWKTNNSPIDNSKRDD